MNDYDALDYYPTDVKAYYVHYVEGLEATAAQRLELLREGLEATKRADGHWSDRVRWMNWVEKVEKE